MKHFYSQIKNFINIALFLGIFLQSYLGNSQTTLAAGDIVFSGFDATATPSPTAADSYSFVLLTNISANTVISFSDRGYAGGGSWASATATTEGAVTWTSGTAIAAGTEIVIKGLTASVYNRTTSTLTPNGTVVATESNLLYGLSLSNVGDQIIIFQGGGGVISAGGVTVITGLTYYTSSGCAPTVATWDVPSGTCTIGPNSSVIPPGLTGGVNAFFTGGATPTSGVFNGTGAPFANVAAIRAALTNQSNWTLSSAATGITMPSGYSFLGVLPTITGNPANRTICPGGNTTFNVTATNATSYKWQVNTGSGFTDLTNGAPYSGVTTATLTITGATTSMNGYLYRCVVSGAGSVNSNSATLSIPNTIVTTTAQTNIFCNGGNTGSATVSASGGFAPYTYSWSPSGGTAATASNLTAQTYTVTVTDNIGCQTPHTVIITEPTLAASSPSITTQPASYAACAGSTASFSVAATNTATYQWEVNTGSGYTPITNGGGSPNYSGSNTANLNISSITSAMNGYTYRVALTSSCSNTITSNGLALLNVTALPVATATPASPTVCSGSSPNIALTSAPTGATFSWTVVTTSGTVSGASAGSGTSINQTLTGNGIVTYTVTPTLNSCPGTPITIPVTVNPLPTITTQPSSSPICAGANTTFSASAANATAYKWQVNQGAGFSDISDNALYSGATTTTLTITAAPGILNGYVYRMVAIGTCTPDAVSNAVALTVNSAPSITAQPFASSICAGANTTFSITAANANGYQWQVDEGAGFNNITNNATYSGATTATLSITGATAGLNGYIYRAVATGTCTPNAVSSSAALTINFAPAITAQPSASTICAGANTTFSVTAANANGYQWQVDQGTGFNNITNNATYSGATTATLTITGATAGLNGYIYRAVATGLCTPNATSNSAALTVNTAPAITAQPSASTICAGANTTFSVTAANATGYQWQVDQGTGFNNITNNATYSGATTATLTITGATAVLNGYIYRAVATGLCTPNATSNSAALTVNTAPAITTQPSAIAVCPGGNTTFSVTAASATGYQWQVDQGAGFNNITNNATYSGTTTATLSITGATAGLNGYIYRAVATGTCTPAAVSNSAALSINSAPAITAQPSASTICAGANTTFSVTAANATGYQWQVDQGAGFNNITNNATYSGTTTATLTIMGATAGLNGYIYRAVATGTCTPAAVSNSAALTINSAPAITAQPSASTICAGANTTFSVTAANTTGYQWQVDEGAGYSNITNGAPYSGATTATLTITGATTGLNGYMYRAIATGVCTPNATSNSAVLTINSAPSITVQPIDNSICVGSNASFSATVSNATGYQWQVNNGSGFNNLTNGGVYSGVTTSTLTITGATAALTNFQYRLVASGNCTPVATSNSAILKISNIQTISTKVDIACNGGNTGSILVTPTGGIGNYTYLWSNGATTPLISNLTAGNYSVSIKDEILCEKIFNFTVNQSPPLVASQGSVINVSCNGGANGSATVNVTGGTPQYTYSWAPSGGTGATASGLAAGTYTVTVTDLYSCTTTQSFTITQPAALVASVGSQTNVSCNGGSNGSATVAVTGGTGARTYSWSPIGGNAATASGLAAGTYTVTVTDANTCQSTQSFTITQPATLTVTPSQTNVLCNGGSTGTATVTAFGGTPGYTYLWSPIGGTSATATGLPIGNYSCLVTDSKGCTATQSFTITQPQVLTATQSQINATCSTGGQAAVSVSGGTLPYTYLWSPSGATSQVVTGLASGNHSVLITDGKGCTLTKNFTIGTTNTLVAATSQTDILCNGSSTGSATVIPSGAPGPFTYVWAPYGGNGDTATNLSAGNYSVTITSSNGCSIVKNFTISQPNSLIITPNPQTNVTCNGGLNGSASISVSGGTGSYTYSWAPSGGTAATATGLAAGTYTVTVTDANLCTKTQSFTITEPAALVATTSQTNVSCNSGSNGTATVNVTGGTGAYSYVWAPYGGTAATASGLAAGTYTVTITDANACQTTATATITEPSLLTATISKTDVSCSGSNDGTATITPLGGTSPYTYSWSPSGGTAATATGLSANTYNVTVTDANGCFVTQSVTIGTTPDITAPVPNVAVLPEITNYCSVLASQISIPTATDNCVGTVNGTTTDPLNYNAVGTYTITWKYDDTSGNSTTQTQTVKVIASPVDAVTFTDAQFTYDGNAHSLQVANLPTGTTVAYSANNGATNAGTYTITATVTPASSSPNCSPIVLTANLIINKAAQQITFDAIPVKTLGANNSFNLTATSSSGLPVSYTFTYTSALAPATVSSTGAVTMLRSGQGVITAQQAGNVNYLPAANVSQALVILNNNIDVKSITLGSKVYDNPGKTIYHLLACGETNPNVSILNESDATITPSANFTIQTPKPGIYTQNATITSQDGTTSAVYSITVEKPFGFFDIVHQKFNNVLLVNNNPQTNGGYEFVAYQWLKNGQPMGTGQYYSAGEGVSTILDPTADYSVKMTTKDGKVLQTCTSKITTTNKLEAKLYPNPVQTGKIITVEADFPEAELQNMQISLYSVTGQLVKTVQSSSVKTEIQLPPTIGSSMYVVVLETPNVKKSFKVIVK